MNPSMDRAAMQEALEELNATLKRHGVRADLYVFGGAAMVLAYGADRPTRDIDAKFEPHGAVLQAAQEVASRLDLPRSWLNDQASVYLSQQRDTGQAPVFDRSHLRVQAASAEHLVAMKVLAAREHDLADLRLLIGRLGLRDAAEAEAITRRFFPDEDIPARNLMALEDLFAG
ncbi:MAG TPA: DUF6036 family nucleotidyltransferase [Egibacteraceae bacterium]|nr:DUF6036 family nucleotidyltransferase [Egibacteraceae bacterium]